LADLAGLNVPWTVPAVAAGEARVASDGVLSSDRLVLEAFEFTARKEGAVEIAAWLATKALPRSEMPSFFADKLQSDLVILDDTAFTHFARQAMVVEPHVRINDDSGTADDGGLFFTENLPPESLLVGLVQASVERFNVKKNGAIRDGERYTNAQRVLDAVLTGPGDGRKGITGSTLQIGGDATTGRGLVLVHSMTTER
jgi:CRISPR-associated protein Cmr4